MNNNLIKLPLTPEEEADFIKNDKKALIVIKEYSESEVLSGIKFLYVSNKQREDMAELMNNSSKTTLQDKYWETKDAKPYKVLNGSEAIHLFEEIKKENPKVNIHFINELSACRELSQKDLVNKLHIKEMMRGINNIYNTQRNQEILTTNSMFFIAHTFVANNKDKKDEFTLLNNFNEFIDKKLQKIIENKVEESNIEKDYLQKLKNYEKENKNTDLSFMNLYNSYKNLPDAVLKQSFREVLKEDLQKEISSKKNIILKKIIDKSKEKQQEVGMDR